MEIGIFSAQYGLRALGYTPKGNTDKDECNYHNRNTRNKKSTHDSYC